MSEEREISERALDGAEPELIGVSTLDLDRCDRMELSVWLLEHEKAGLRFESWPPTVQRQMEKQIVEWQARRPERAIRAITTAVHNRMCVMVFHHGPKS